MRPLFLPVMVQALWGSSSHYTANCLHKPMLTAHLMLLKARLTPEGCLVTASMADGSLCTPGSSAAPVQRDWTYQIVSAVRVQCPLCTAELICATKLS